MTRRSAPRRQVVSVEHRSGYGRTLWLHTLECGHVEPRKRKAPATQIGCLACERSAESARAIDAALAAPLVQFDSEGELLRIQASLARALGVDTDAVSLQIRPPARIEGALVTLDAKTVQRLAEFS